MIVEVNLNELYTDEIDCAQYVFLKLLDKPEELSKFIETGLIANHEFEDLKSKKFLENDSDLSGEIIPTDKARKKFNLKDSTFFDEFYQLYPAYVQRIDNTKDYLRTNVIACRKLYNKIVGKSIEQHKHIIECLTYELEFRRKNSKMGWMVRMQKWLSTNQWEMAEEMMKDSSITKLIDTGSGYGTEIE